MNALREQEYQVSLATLVKGIGPIIGAIADGNETKLSGIELDSRLIKPGDLFLACKGEQVDGRNYIESALEKGASAVLYETENENLAGYVEQGRPIIPIVDLGEKIGMIAARFFSYPANDLWIIAITGTNGKTSCCDFISQSFVNLGYGCGISGTLGSGLYKKNELNCSIEMNDINLSKTDLVPGLSSPATSPATIPSTTPDAVSVQKIFEFIRNNKASIMTMEVSSHGLEQNRVNVEEFDVAIFTNLSHDHLDYHGTMEAYGNVKKKLFIDPKLKVAVVNLDDPLSASIIDKVSKNTKSFSYSLHNEVADVFPRALQFTRTGFYFELVSPWGECRVESVLLGAFNVSNLLATITTVMATESTKANFNFDNVIQAIACITPVKGRMEIVENYPVSVVVDYAHTPDGLENALKALKSHYSGKICCLFGCGGDRDKEKRPLMAAVAEQYADTVMVTDDNPRMEKSIEIIEQIMTGFSIKKVVSIEADRDKAIKLMIKNANNGDVIFIAGKGHEEYQETAGKRMPFSDVKKASLCLHKRFKQTG